MIDRSNGPTFETGHDSVKREWARPEVDRLVPGSAGAGPGQDVEGLDGTS